MTRVLLAAGALLLLALPSLPASAETRTMCKIEGGSRNCITISVVRRTTHIMGIPAKKYIRGIRNGDCMPSPAGPGICAGE